MKVVCDVGISGRDEVIVHLVSAWVTHLAKEKKMTGSRAALAIKKLLLSTLGT